MSISTVFGETGKRACVAPLGVALRQRFPVLPRPNLDWTPEVEAATAHLYERVSKVMPPVEWPFHAPYVKAINELKRERNAVILAHNYQTPEIYHCVADYVGDSLQLAKLAAASAAEVIVQAGVHFMAETSKILSPEKTVLIPDSEAGCSLAASITGADVRALREEYPGVPVVAYVNTSAEVKAEVDICCTSSNALKDRREPRLRSRHHAAGQISGAKCRRANKGEDHRLARRLRGSRAVHGRGNRELPRRQSRREDHRASRMPARSR